MMSVSPQAAVEPVLSSAREILGVLNRLYDTGANTAAKVIEDLDTQALGRFAQNLDGPQDILDQDTEAPIIQLVNSILTQAVRDRASDIHIESFERELKVRYRIDGVFLHLVLSPPKPCKRRLFPASRSWRTSTLRNALAAGRAHRHPRGGEDVDIRVSACLRPLANVSCCASG